MSADDIYEAKELAAAMRGWAAEKGGGSGLLLIEGAKVIETMVAEIEKSSDSETIGS